MAQIDNEIKTHNENISEIIEKFPRPSATKKTVARGVVAFKPMR